jgi:hypothetical protein
MSHTRRFVLIALAIGIVAAYYVFSGTTTKSLSTTKSPQSGDLQTDSTRASKAFSKLAPEADADRLLHAQRAISPERAIVLASGDYKAAYDSLASFGPASADAKFYRAAILEKCSDMTSAISPAQAAEFERLTNEKLKGQPNAITRKAALDSLKQRRIVTLCAGFATNPPTAQQAREAMSALAAEGDLRAKARMVELDLLANARDMPATSDKFPVKLKIPDALKDDQIETLKRAISSRDPVAILLAGPLLTSQYENMTVTFGEQREALSTSNMEALWPLVACSFGANCTESSTRLLEACAYQNRCNVKDYATYLNLYELTADQVEQLARARTIVMSAISTGDWSQMQFQRGASNTVAFMPETPRPIPFGR